MHPSTIEIIATSIFGLAVLHTFFAKKVEVVFGFWGVLYLGVEYAFSGTRSRDFTECLFLFVILIVSASRPILTFAENLIVRIARILPLAPPIAFYFVALTLGPILGSFITEPAAMTVTALLLLDRYFENGISMRLKYATLGLLFVNISIGGVLTPYAAPAVLMVAKAWGWDMSFMFTHFGWKAILVLLLSTSLITFHFKKEIAEIPAKPDRSGDGIPAWVTLAHFVLLSSIIVYAHEAIVFSGIFLLFLLLAKLTKVHQEKLQLHEGALVAFFLAGLVILGSPQRWWLEPILTSLGILPLYLGSIGLTSIIDNAALTYLGVQVPNLTVAAKYALVSGSIVGGGLTVIANAPNPAGFGLLRDSFGEEGIHPLKLFLAALFPTLLAALCFWFL